MIVKIKLVLITLNLIITTQVYLNKEISKNHNSFLVVVFPYLKGKLSQNMKEYLENELSFPAQLSILQ